MTVIREPPESVPGAGDRRLEAHVVHDERVDVGRRLQCLGLAARAVARLGVDPDQDRRVLAGLLLERGRVLEGVRRHDAVIVIGVAGYLAPALMLCSGE